MALCFWSSLGWLSADWLPGRMAPLAGAGLRLLLIGIGGAALGGFRVRGQWKVTCMGLLLVGAPFLLLHEAQGMLTAGFVATAFALVPVGVMLVEGDLARLPWALGGAGGLLMILPAALPSTESGWIGAGLIVAAAGLTAYGLVGIRSLLSHGRLANSVGAIGLMSGAVLLLAGMLEGATGWGWDALGGEVLHAVLLDLPQVMLLVWLLREVTALRVSVRYLGAPLLTILEGWALLREVPGTRMVVGLVMLAGGAYGLLRKDVVRTEVGLSLR